MSEGEKEGPALWQRRNCPWTFRTAAAGMHSHPDFGLAESRVLARREAHVAGEDELAAHAPDTASDLRDADHRGLGETHERIHQDREARSPEIGRAHV